MKVSITLTIHDRNSNHIIMHSTTEIDIVSNRQDLMICMQSRYECGLKKD